MPVEIKPFLAGKKKLLAAAVAGALSTVITTWLIDHGVDPKAAVTVAGLVVSGFLGYIGLEGVRDIINAWRQPTEPK